VEKGFGNEQRPRGTSRKALLFPDERIFTTPFLWGGWEKRREDAILNTAKESGKPKPMNPAGGLLAFRSYGRSGQPHSFYRRRGFLEGPIGRKLLDFSFREKSGGKNRSRGRKKAKG